jgi:hypothetical protein
LGIEIKEEPGILEPGQWYDTKPTKGVEPANEATFHYQSSFVNYFGGTPYT